MTILLNVIGIVILLGALFLFSYDKKSINKTNKHISIFFKIQTSGMQVLPNLL